MADEFPTDRFATSEELIKRLKEQADDIDGLHIVVANHLPMVTPKGDMRLVNGCCSMIKLCTGESILIHRDELQNLLNDGILSRMKVPISLAPLYEE
jgi:predicted RNA-binding protein associated with RNAse of E/G family